MAEKRSLKPEELVAIGMAPAPKARPKLTAEAVGLSTPVTKAPVQAKPETAAVNMAAESFMTGILGYQAGVETLKSGLVQFGKMLTDTVGLTNGAEAQYTSEVAGEHKARENIAKALPAYATGKAIGESAPLAAIPMGGATVLGRAAVGATIGGGLGATEYVDDDETRARNTLEEAAFGVGVSLGLDAVVGAIGGVARIVAKGRVDRSSPPEAPSSLSETPEPQGDIELKATIKERLAARAEALAGDNTSATLRAKGQHMLDKLKELDYKPMAKAQADAAKEAQTVFEAQKSLDNIHTHMETMAKEGLNPKEAMTRALKEEGYVRSDLKTLTALARKRVETTTGRKILDVQRQAELKPAIEITPDMPVAQAAKIYHNTLPDGTMVRSIPSTGTDFVLGRLSTRIRAISPNVFHRLREFDFRSHLRETEYLKGISSLSSAYTRLRKAQRTELNKALLRQDWDVASNVLSGLQGKTIRDATTGKKFTFDAGSAVTQTKKTLQNIYEAKRASGMDIGFLEDYFPRTIKDMKVFTYQMDSNTRKLAEKALKESAEKKGKELTDLEKAALLTKMVKGGPHMAGVRDDKSRKVSYVTDNILDAYDDSMDSLLHYVRSSAHEIEKAKYLGKASTETTTGGSIGEVLAREHSLGNITAKELHDLAGDPKELDELTRLLKIRAIGADLAPGKKVQAVRNAFYSSLIGHPTSALQNVVDVGIAGYAHGFGNAAIAAVKSLFPNGKVLRQSDIGLNQLVQEMAETRGHARFLNNVLSYTGFKRMDRLGKEAIINSAWMKMGKLVKTEKGLREFENKWVPLFGEQPTREMVRNIRSGKLTDDAKLALWHEVADLQPVSLSEMPEAYLKMANGRIWYMLKSYTISALDIYRRDIFRTARVDPARAAKNLVKLGLAAGAAGATIQQISNMISGKPMEDWDDATIGALLKHMGVSSYMGTQYERGKKPSEIMMGAIVPPVGIPLDVVGEMEKTGSIWGGIKAVPGVGRMLYNWFGGGAEKATQRKEDEEVKLLVESDIEEEPKKRRLTREERRLAGLD